MDSIIKVLTSQPSLTYDQNLILLDALQKAVNDNQTPTNMDNIKHLIKLQYKLKNISDLVSTAVKMIQLFPENIYPLEWVCKVYLETCVGVWAVDTPNIWDNIEMYFSALISFSSKNSLGHLARGAFLFQTGEFEECVTLLKVATEVTSPNFYGLYILCLAQGELNDEFGVKNAASEALKHTSKVKDDLKRQEMTSVLNIAIIKALYNQLSKEKIKEAYEVLEKCEKSPEILKIAAKVYATLGYEEKVQELLSSCDFSECEKHLIQALIHRSKGKISEFTNLMSGILVKTPEDFEVTVLLAQMFFDQGNKEESFGLFLRSAKLNSSHWLPFFYLGRQYEEQGSEAALEKARKCYQKCVQVSGSSNVEAAIALSDILRAQGRHQDNLQLLSRVTREAGTRGGAAWAWLRLGVHHLAAEQPGLAVTALQNALRSDSDNAVCWEALGDAYMARGSYVAARKAFEKVVSVSSESSYSRLMIADIKQKLGHHRDAILDYTHLLDSAPDYLPALRGLGETHLALAGLHLQQFVDLNVLDSCRHALAALTRAAVLRPGMAGTWRLLGEAAGLVSGLSAEVVRVEVPSMLMSAEAGPEDTEEAGRGALLELSVRCYTRALVLEQDSAATWHDLALSQAALGNLAAAVTSLKRAIGLSPRQAQLWSSLGAVLVRQQLPAAAQHCLVRALELDTTAASWTNLGVIYLQLGDQGLANKAFKEAQNCSPDYVRGWTGQAVLAEVAGVRSECMDLFRHCTFLGPEPESARGYSDWVCATLASLERGERVEAHNKYILDKMHGVSVGVDSLAAYTRRHPRDVAALCQLGVLAERQGLVRTAAEATEAALQQVTEAEQRDKILTNLGRLLTKLGRCEAAVASFQAVSSPSLHTQAGLAMAQYKLGRYQDSYQAYDSCLHWLADQDGLKSHILVAMGNLAYKVEGMEAAKTLLFRSCQLSPPSVRGLFALCVIGVQHSDMNLIEAALSEMRPHEQDPRHAADIALLRASILVLRGDVAAARRSLVAAAHQQPWLAGLWSHLALFLLQNCPRSARAAATLAAKAGVMRQGCGDRGEQRGLASAADTEVVATIGLMMAGDRGRSLARASHAAHMFPHLAESWAVLAAAARVSQSPATSSAWLTRVVSHVTRLGAGNTALTDWAARVAAAL